MEKGHKPEHIELEPKWKLGRGVSGGRADILVKGNLVKPLLNIECKTAGNEFKKAWNKTLQEGDQLFSYAQQISETQFMCLYISDFENGSINEKVRVYGNLQGGQKRIFDGYVIRRSNGVQIIVNNPAPHFGFIIQTAFE